MDRGNPLLVTPEGAVRFFGVIAVLLLAAHVGGLVAEYAFDRDTLLGIIPLVDFDQERNVPTLFSASLFLVAAALLGLVAREHRSAGRPFRVWLFLAGLACFLSVDEVAGIHEMLADPLRDSLGASGAFHHAWVIPYGIAAIVLAGFVFPVFWRMRSATRNRFFVAAGVYVGGAVGLEMVAGKYQQLAGVTRDVVYESISTVEESMEMAGLILAVRAIVSLLSYELGGVTVAVPAVAAETPAREALPKSATPGPEPAATRPAPAAARSAAQNIR
jgi:hypothetical protein